MNIKKTTISITLLIGLFLVNLSPVFAKDTSSKNKPCKLASKVSECKTQKLGCQDKKGVEVNDTPRNCLFLEEPIGGKKGWDLYKIGDCKKDKKGNVVCQTVLWKGGAIHPSKGERGPIQAILTEDKSKPYQGPFTLLYNYLNLVYTYMSGLIVGVAVLFVVIGGIQMTTAAGDEQKFGEGRSRITKAIAGIILWFTASLILYTINPTFFTF